MQITYDAEADVLSIELRAVPARVRGCWVTLIVATI